MPACIGDWAYASVPALETTDVGAGGAEPVVQFWPGP
jgi:hypothetical protein